MHSRYRPGNAHFIYIRQVSSTRPRYAAAAAGAAAADAATLGNLLIKNQLLLIN